MENENKKDLTGAFGGKDSKKGARPETGKNTESEQSTQNVQDKQQDESIEKEKYEPSLSSDPVDGKTEGIKVNTPSTDAKGTVLNNDNDDDD